MSWKEIKEEKDYKPRLLVSGGISKLLKSPTNQYAGDKIKELVETCQDDQRVFVSVQVLLDAVTARDEILAGAKITFFPSFSMQKLRKCTISTAHRTFQAVLPSQRSRLHLKPSEIIKNSSRSTLSPAYISLQSRHRPQVSVMVKPEESA